MTRTTAGGAGRGLRRHGGVLGAERDHERVLGAHELDAIALELEPAGAGVVQALALELELADADQESANGLVHGCTVARAVGVGSGAVRRDEVRAAVHLPPCRGTASGC